MKFYCRLLYLSVFLGAPSGMGAVSIKPIQGVDVKLISITCLSINEDEAFLKVELLAEKSEDQWSIRGQFYGVNYIDLTSERRDPLVFSLSECQSIRSNLLTHIAKPIVVDGVLKASTDDIYEEIWGMCPVRRTGDSDPCYKGSRLVSKTKIWTFLKVDGINLLNAYQ